MKKPSISELIADKSLLTDENNYMFFDWHCGFSDLKKQARACIAELKDLVDQGVIDGDSTVSIKNCETSAGVRYNVYYLDNTGVVIIPKVGEEATERCRISYKDENNENVNLGFSCWEAFKDELTSNKELREKLTKYFS